MVAEICKKQKNIMDIFDLQNDSEQWDILRALQQGAEEKEEHWSAMIGTTIELKNSDDANKPVAGQKV